MEDDFHPITILVLSIVEFCVSLKILIDSLRWMKRHPTGADPERRFVPWLVIATLLGIAVLSLLVIAGAVPSYDRLTEAHGQNLTNPYFELFVIVLACFPCLGIFAWHRKVSRKANVVAFLAALNLLFLPGAFLLFCYLAIVVGP